MATELKNLLVEKCAYFEAGKFITEHHYTHSVKGATPEVCFKVIDKSDGRIVGAALFGKPAQVQTEDKYAERINDSVDGRRQWRYKLVELRRLVLLDEAPRNSESKVLGIMLRELAKLGVQRVLSYADPNEKRSDHPDGKHTGLIYRATGFHKILGSKSTKAIWWNGRRYPIRNIDQYVNYHQEPNGTSIGTKAWKDVPDERKILRKEKYKDSYRWVWVMKIPEELVPYAKKLREALKNEDAVFLEEEGKIGYLKGLLTGDPYFEPPKPKKSIRPESGRRTKSCLCCND